MKLFIFKNIRTVLIVFLLLSSAFAQAQNVNTEEKALQALTFAKTLNQFSNAYDEPTRILDAFLAATEALSEDSSLNVVAESLLSFPIMNKQHEYARISACSAAQHNSLIRNYVYQQFHSSDSTSVVYAARVLLKWGNYDESIPIILKTKHYSYFEYPIINKMPEHNKVQIIDQIRDVNSLINHTWREKLHAAIIAQRLGIQDQLPAIIEKILRDVPLDSGEKNINQCKFEAIENMQKYNYMNYIKYLPRLANDESRLVRMQTVVCANYYAKKGNKDALRALEEISNNSNDLRLKETAKGYLKKLEK